MIRLARRTSLLVAFCLLTSAATASAECAWVLWTQTEGSRSEPRKSEWEFDRNVYETRNTCESALEQEREKVVKSFSSAGAQLARRLPVEHDFFIRLGDRSVTIGRRNDPATSDWWLTYKYACLPDALDPRGPKGE